MRRWKYLIFILACLSQIGCTALFTEQEHVLIDRPVSEKITFHGEIYSLPETVNVRKGSESCAAWLRKNPKH